MIRTMTAAALLMLLAACETTQGVGQDVENAGEALEETIEG
jgi:predicted small secreted protein